MILLVSKCAYTSLLKTSRLELRFKHSASLKLFTVLADMPRLKDNSPQSKIDASLNFIGLEVLGNGSGLSPCGISLNTTPRSYLFNCGEGIQKILSEYRIKPSRFHNIFFTYPSWKNIGGLVGTALSLQESNVKSFTIHGHPCLEELFHLTRSFVNFKGIQQNLRCCEHNEQFADDYITVKFIHLHESPSTSLNENVTKSGCGEDEKEVNVSTVEERGAVDEEHDGGLLSEQSSDRSVGVKEGAFKYRHNYAISFIIHSKRSTGALSFEKCVDLGVPVGPLLGKLKKGEDVQLPDGRVIKSSDVKLPDLPGVIVIVVECPSEDYLDSLLREPAYFKHMSGSEEFFGCTVVHLSSAAVVQNKKYQEWMSRFSKDTRHVFVNESSEIGAFVGPYRNQFKLNMVHPEIFPPLEVLGIPESPRIENAAVEEGHVIADLPPFMHDKNSPLQIHSEKMYYQCVDNMNIQGESLCEIILKPKKGYDYSKCLTLKKKEYLEQVLAVPNVQEELEEYKKKIRSVEEELASDRRVYPKIVFLGTGSKKPSKTRNASGILVFFNEKESIILDCGESSYGQLLLIYGKEGTKQVLRSLNAIFISHMHIDHHLGLTSLLLQRKLAFDELEAVSSGSESAPSFKPLPIIAPVQLLPFLHYLSQKIIDISHLYELVSSSELTSSSPQAKYKKIITDLNLESMQTVYVHHSAHSFGVAIKHLDGWKLTYSGDTKPCDSLINVGQGSDILIHEATFDDIYKEEASAKLHSTTGQAIMVGRKMNAKFILLTHFSQRYCYLPLIRDELLSKGNVGVAFDFMQVSPYQLPILPFLYEPIKLIFSTYQEKLEQQQIMIKLKRERDKVNNPQPGFTPPAVKIPKKQTNNVFNLKNVDT